MKSAALLLLVGLNAVVVRGASDDRQTTPTGCSTVVLTFFLRAGDVYDRRIGEQLTFRVRVWDQKREGWRFTVEDGAGHDFIYPVNPPLRFNPAQFIGQAYGLSAEESLGMKRELRFLLNESDYERFDPFLIHALWPGDSPHPDTAADDYLRELSRVPTGLLCLKVLRSEVDDDDVIRWAKFQVEMIAPVDFPFDASLGPRPAAACQTREARSPAAQPEAGH